MGFLDSGAGDGWDLLTPDQQREVEDYWDSLEPPPPEPCPNCLQEGPVGQHFDGREFGCQAVMSWGQK